MWVLIDLLFRFSIFFNTSVFCKNWPLKIHKTINIGVHTFVHLVGKGSRFWRTQNSFCQFLVLYCSSFIHFIFYLSSLIMDAFKTGHFSLHTACIVSQGFGMMCFPSCCFLCGFYFLFNFFLIQEIFDCVSLFPSTCN